jgi:hypothetical protein
LENKKIINFCSTRKTFTKEVNRVTKIYLGILTIGKKFEIKNFAKIESKIKNWTKKNGVETGTPLSSRNLNLAFPGIVGNMGKGSLAKKWHETLKKLTDVIKNIETQLQKDIQGKNNIQSKIQALGNPDYTINPTFLTKTTFTEVKQAIEFAQTKNSLWDKTMITKYHCPVRFQGKAIMKSIGQFKENLKKLNKKEDINDYTKFPYNITEWKGDNNLTKKTFVVFTNIRLDFTEDLCTDSRYEPICAAYDDSLKFSHDLLYSEQQKVEEDGTYKTQINVLFNNLKEQVESRKFGKKRKKKVSKKTSTRSFRKRDRRRAPSEIEIL